MKLPYQGFHTLTILLQNTLDFIMHAQGSLEMGFILEGSCRYICSNKEYILQPGDAFIAFPNQPHAFYESEGLSAYLLIIPVTNYLSAYNNILTKLTPSNPVLHASEYDPTIMQILEHTYRDAQNASSIVMQGYMQVIFGKLLESLQLQEHQTGTEGALQKILAFLNENYQEQLSREQISRAVGYNESYISHIFAETMHISVPEYIHMLRVDDACNMLLQTSVPISQIAVNLGFGSIRSFNRVFRIQTGMTPREYRAASFDHK